MLFCLIKANQWSRRNARVPIGQMLAYLLAYLLLTLCTSFLELELSNIHIIHVAWVNESMNFGIIFNWVDDGLGNSII
jgi:hypothetical protein